MNKLNQGKKQRKHLRRMFQKNVISLFCFMLLFSPFSTVFGDNVEDSVTVEAREITSVASLAQNDIHGDLADEVDLAAIVAENDSSNESGSEIEVKTIEIDPNEEQGTLDVEIDQGDSLENVDDTVEIEVPAAASLDIELLSNEADYQIEDNADGTVTITAYMGTDKDIVIPETIGGKTVTKLGLQAFQNKGLTSVIIPNSVIEIGWDAFHNNKLTQITIPNGVTKIDWYAFQKNELESVNIPDSVTSIGPSAFENNQIRDITIGSQVTSIGQSAFSSNPLETVTVHAANVSFKDINNKGIYSMDGKLLVQGTLSGEIVPGTEQLGAFSFAGMELQGEFTIPNGVTRIEQGVFRDNNLTAIVLPSGVTHIGAKAFVDNKLKSVVIPEGVIAIGQYAFSSNELTSIILPSSLKTIDRGIFNRNNSLHEIIIKSKDLIFDNEDISDHSGVKVMWGHEGSTAEQYAIDKGYIFNPEGTVITSYLDVSNNSIDGITDVASKQLLRDPENDFSPNVYQTFPADINGYELTQTIGEESGPYTLEEQIVTYVYSKITYTVTVTYEDEKGNELVPAIILTGELDKPYESEEKEINGYTLMETPVNAAGKFTTEPQEVRYVYMKDEVIVPDKEIIGGHFDWVPLKTGWYDIKDLPLRQKVEVSLDDGSKVELAIEWNMVSEPVYDKNKEGNYQFSGEFVLIDGVSNPKGYKAQRGFVLTDALVMIRHVDTDGNELLPEETLAGKLNAEYTTEAKKIVGYTLTEIPANATGKFTDRDMVVTYVYSKDVEATLDREIIGRTSQGTIVDVGTKELADIIENLPTKVSVTLDDDSVIELNVAQWDVDSVPAYDKDSAGMYIFSGEIELVDGILNSAGIRAIFSVSLNDIVGPGEPDKIITAPHYNWVPLKVGMYEQSDLPLPETVVVSLNDNSKVELEVVWRADSEPIYDKDIAGEYLFTGEFQLIDGIANPQGLLAYRYFTLTDDDKTAPEPSVVIVTHVDGTGNELAPSKTLTGAEGETYETYIEVIKGYTFNKVIGDVSGIFTKAPIFVEYVYEKDSEYLDPIDREEPEDSTVEPIEPTDKGKEVVKVDVAIATDKTSTKLPKTATSYYSIGLGGLLLIIVGGAIYAITRKKRMI